MKKSTIFQTSVSKPEHEETTETSKLATRIFIITFIVAFLFFLGQGFWRAVSQATVFIIVLALVLAFTGDF